MPGVTWWIWALATILRLAGSQDDLKEPTPRPPPPPPTARDVTLRPRPGPNSFRPRPASMNETSSRQVPATFGVGSGFCLPAMSPPQNGYFLQPCSNSLGSLCSFACLPGFTMVGSPTTTCLITFRLWSTPPPLCVPSPAVTGLIGGMTSSSSRPQSGQGQGLSGSSSPSQGASSYRPLTAGGGVGYSIGNGLSQGTGTNAGGVSSSNSNNPGTGMLGGLSLIPSVSYRPNGGITGLSSLDGFRPDSGVVIGPVTGTFPGIFGPGLIPGTGALQQPGIIVCPSLLPPPNGIRAGQCERAVPGSTCLFSCLPGYILSGYPILTCTQTGQWSPTPLPPNCLTQGLTTGQTIVTTDSTTEPPHTTGVTLRPTTFTPVCPPLQSPRNGVARGNCVNARNGQTCFFSCLAKFIISGNPVLTCRNGDWSSETPTCRGMIAALFSGYSLRDWVSNGGRIASGTTILPDTNTA